MATIENRTIPIGLVLSFVCLSMLVLPHHGRCQAQDKGGSVREQKVQTFGEKSVNELLGDLITKGDKTALPPLRQAFEDSNSKLEKQTIASTLLSYGDKDIRFLEYLAGFAKTAIESDMPFPIAFDSQGSAIRGQYSSEFVAWAARNRIDPHKAAEEAMFGQPGDVLFLASAVDSRAFDLLLRGLEAKNYFVVANAARGLARLQDARAIRPIIEACKRAPPELARLIAEALVYFDDPEAQAAAERFILNKAVLNELRQRAKERGVKAIFGF